MRIDEIKKLTRDMKEAGMAVGQLEFLLAALDECHVLLEYQSTSWHSWKDVNEETRDNLIVKELFIKSFINKYWSKDET
jgi:hypothetical protein